MAIDHAALNSVYNYYLTTYAPKTDSKFDTHKKSELRGVYNSIVKMNKEAPLYIVDKSQETKEYAVGIKENARAFRNTIASLGGLDDNELLNKKVAYSSNESIATVSFVGDNIPDSEVPSFSLTVNELATSQVNVGEMLKSDELTLQPNTYSFDIAINGLNYEFQYNVHEDDTNKGIQDKLARLISNAGIGLKSEVLTDGEGNSALKIESVNSGRGQNGTLFQISDNNTSKASGSVSYFGIDEVVRESKDAQFTINGEEHSSANNEFMVEKLYEVHLTGISKSAEDVANIDVKADLESMAANIKELIEGYNAFVDTADKYSDNHPKSERLVREMSALASLHEEGLKNIGISVMEDGRIALDENDLKKAVSEGELTESKDALKAFAGAMLRKTNQVALNPMHYADRTIVAYKNPGHNYATPYVTSAYTGMMFNSYC